MTIIKVLNNRIRFEHPIVLNSDKQYRLGVSHLLFEFDQTFSIDNFMFDFLCAYISRQRGYRVIYHIRKHYRQNIRERNSK